MYESFLQFTFCHVMIMLKHYYPNHGRESYRRNTGFQSSRDPSYSNCSIHKDQSKLLNSTGIIARAIFTQCTYACHLGQGKKKHTYAWFHNLKEKWWSDVVKSVLYVTEEEKIFVFVRNRNQSEASQKKPGRRGQSLSEPTRCKDLEMSHYICKYLW